MRKAADVAGVANNGMLGQIGRTLMLIAEWYAGCSGYFPLEGFEAYIPRAPGETSDFARARPDSRQN